MTSFKNELLNAAKHNNAKCDDYTDAMRKIKDVLAAINEQLHNVSCKAEMEPGHRVSIGQQYNIVILMADRGFRDVLIRIYVPSSGYPAHLDTFGDTLEECNNAKSFATALKHFFESNAFGARMEMYREIGN